MPVCLAYSSSSTRKKSMSTATAPTTQTQRTHGPFARHQPYQPYACTRRLGMKRLRLFGCAGQYGIALSMSPPFRVERSPSTLRLGSASSILVDARQSGQELLLLSACLRQRLQNVCWQQGSITGVCSSSRHIGHVRCSSSTLTACAMAWRAQRQVGAPWVHTTQHLHSAQ